MLNMLGSNRGAEDKLKRKFKDAIQDSEGLMNMTFHFAKSQKV